MDGDAWSWYSRARAYGRPEGKVPVLLIDGRVLTEVAGILWYLARRYPAAQLLEVERFLDASGDGFAVLVLDSPRPMAWPISCAATVNRS